MKLDVDSYAHLKAPLVLIAVAIPGESCVIAIDRAEFAALPGVEIARAMGCTDYAPLAAFDKVNDEFLKVLAATKRKK